MKNKVVDIVCVCLVGVLFGSIALLNLIQPNRPTESEMEKRPLAEFPEFSVESLADGTFFSGISTFVSDTFLYRDNLVGLSKKLDTLRGIDYSIDGGDSFVMLDGNTGGSTADADENKGAADKIAEAFDNLENKTDDQTSTDSSGAESGSIAQGEIADEPTDVTDGDNPEQTDQTSKSDEEPVGQSDSPDGELSGNAPDTDPAEDIADTTGNESGDSEQNTDANAPAEESKVTAIYLSKSSIKLTVGSGSVVYATVDSTGSEGATVKWSISDKNIASISMNPSGGIDVKGVAEGNCVLTCSYGEGENTIKQKCDITVTTITTAAASPEEHADFLTDGMFIYGDAVYTQAFYSETNSTYYAQAAAYYKKLFGENTRMNVVIAPVSSMVVDSEEVKAKIPDQKNILDKMAALMDDSVNFVDAYSEMYDHRDEYLFFKSDHHWTARGAYYAYSAFAKSIGLEPTPIDGFDYAIRNDSYQGSMYSFTYDARVKNFRDTIEAFYPRKKNTMTVTGANGATYNYDSCIVSTNSTYVTFIAGDNPYTVINVPDNPQDMNVLVLKDSFGNAFVPFLCEHYGNIIVVDTRYSNFNIYDQLKDYGLTDIIFVNNIQAANSFTWSKMYLGAVGVNIGG